jgi:hypothetical protein
MSIVEESGRAVGPRLVRVGGYGLLGLAFAAAIWAQIAPGPVTAAAALIATAASLGVAASWPELFQTGSDGRGGFNGLGLAPSIVLVAGALGVRFVDGRWPWIGAGVGAACGLALGLMQMRRRGVSNRWQLVLLLTLSWAAFGFGAIVLADARLDAAPGQLVQTRILAKAGGPGERSSTTTLRLAPAPAAPTTVAAQSFDERTRGVGDPICLRVHPGALGLAWYALTPCPDRAGA